MLVISTFALVLHSLYLCLFIIQTPILSRSHTLVDMFEFFVGPEYGGSSLLLFWLESYFLHSMYIICIALRRGEKGRGEKERDREIEGERERLTHRDKSHRKTQNHFLANNFDRIERFVCADKTNLWLSTYAQQLARICEFYYLHKTITTITTHLYVPN